MLQLRLNKAINNPVRHVCLCVWIFSIMYRLGSLSFIVVERRGLLLYDVWPHFSCAGGGWELYEVS